MVALSKGSLANKLARAHKEHHNFDNVGAAPQSKDVLVYELFLHDILPSQALVHSHHRIAKLGCGLVLLTRSLLVHALFKPPQQYLVLARQEHHHIIDLLAVGLFRHRIDAGARAALDLILQAHPIARF